MLLFIAKYSASKIFVFNLQKQNENILSSITVRTKVECDTLHIYEKLCLVWIQTLGFRDGCHKQHFKLNVFGCLIIAIYLFLGRAVALHLFYLMCIYRRVLQLDYNQIGAFQCLFLFCLHMVDTEK